MMADCAFAWWDRAASTRTAGCEQTGCALIAPRRPRRCSARCGHGATAMVDEGLRRADPQKAGLLTIERRPPPVHPDGPGAMLTPTLAK
jgi:hypothetical protein